MGFSKVFKSIPKDAIEWGRFFSGLTPDPGTISTDTLTDRQANSVFGRAENTPGPGSDIVSSANSQVLIRRTGTLQFDGIQVADLPTAVATDDEVAAAIDAHVAASDPHPGYTTATELASAISAHEAASDPHPVYLTQTEGDARYLQQTLSLTNAADDAAAAMAGVSVGHLYRNGSVVMIRVA